MATLQAAFFCSAYPASFRKIRALLNPSKRQSSSHLSPPKPPVVALNLPNGLQTFVPTSTNTEMVSNIDGNAGGVSRSKPMQELYIITEIVADRAEMHKNVAAQRDNWNRLLLNSVNGMTLTAGIMAGLAAVSGVGAPILALKLSASLLYMAATGILLVMNKIQPSQLAEEQRNASRLFKQLHGDIKVALVIRDTSANDVEDVTDVTEKVLALDKAYPLPLIGAMLDKFSETLEPAVWWPHHLRSQQDRTTERMETNGWNENLEEEMREVLGVLKRKDDAEYVKLGKVVLKINKILAISGPLFTILAAVGSILVGLPQCGSWPAFLGVMFGALATVVSTMEHGGQVGMVFEMYRDTAGFFRLMEETIESTLEERKVGEREDGELFELKVALLLGRSPSELRGLAKASSLPSGIRQDKEESASKLF